MNVTLYTTGTCAYCHAEKLFLGKHQIDFTEVRVDEDEHAAKEMIALSGQMGVPVTVIAKDDTREYIVGFDQQRLIKSLGI